MYPLYYTDNKLRMNATLKSFQYARQKRYNYIYSI